MFTTDQLDPACPLVVFDAIPYFSRRRVSLAKKPSTALSQEQDVGTKWKAQRMPRQPGAHLGLLVRGAVVEDHMDYPVRRKFGFDGVEGADEFLMAVALHVAVDHRAIERGEQCGRVVAFLGVGSWSHRRWEYQTGLFRPDQSNSFLRHARDSPEDDGRGSDRVFSLSACKSGARFP